jgi:hypothetical protein
MAGGYIPVQRPQDEAFKVYQMADPGKIPNPTYANLYATMILLFDALQAAGPDLTPLNFERGLASLPTSVPGGMYGPWKFGPGTTDPASGFQIMWWSPKGIDPEDGLPGVYRACNDGNFYSYFGNPVLPFHQQLTCFSPP